MNDFQKRLTHCIRDGNMTVADLSHWFGRKYVTVRSWAIDGREPRGPAGDRARYLLQELEKKIRKGWQVPVELSNTARPEFMKGLRRERNSAGLSSPHSTG